MARRAPDPGGTGSRSRGWYAEPPANTTAQRTLGDDERSVGRHIRLMVDGPGLSLWDAEGRLPEDTEFVAEILGLSDALVDDLTAWTSLKDEGRLSDSSMSQWIKAGERLRVRLGNELGPDFDVKLVL